MKTLTGPNWTIYVADVRDGLAALPAGSVHCAVTSPPYWRLRDYGVAGQIGLEGTPQEYVDNLTSIFLQMAGVLRMDAVAWVNIGDTYIGRGSGGAGGSFGADRRCYRDRVVRTGEVGGLKIGEMALVPERFAISMQSIGYWVRSRITWHKPNAMPESAPDRCGRDDEPVFMLAPARKHYFDRLGVMFPASPNTHSRGAGINPKARAWDERLVNGNAQFRKHVNGLMAERRCRTVWTIPTAPFGGNHFAAFPPALVERCLRLTTSRGGACRQCGAQLVRLIDSVRVPTRPGRNTKLVPAQDHKSAESFGWSRPNSLNRDPHRHVTASHTIGWSAGCDCPGAIVHPGPPVVLDPFAGVCSTGVAALRLGCRFVGIELNEEYARAGHQRLHEEYLRLTQPAKAKRPRRHRPKRGGRLLFQV